MRSADEELGDIAYHAAAYEAASAATSLNPFLGAMEAGEMAARAVAWQDAVDATRNVFTTARSNAMNSERAAQCHLLNDIFGNPFHPASFNPAWRTRTAVNLAHAIYDERAFDRMPILGDALEEAGCTNADILDHCRQPGEHVKGCWVVDSVLGKE
jgi:hypothetical protein